MAMLFGLLIRILLWINIAVAVPAVPLPQASVSNSNSVTSQAPDSEGVATTFGPDSTVAAIYTQAPAAPPRISSNPTGATSHGPFSGQPTTTGAVKASTTL